MTQTADPPLDPLLRPINPAERALLEVVGDCALRTGGWPIYQYVEAKLDDLNLDLAAVLASLPTIQETAGHTRYSLVWRDRTGGESAPIKLTVAGLAHLPKFTSTVAMFLRVLNELAARRAAATFDPHAVVEVEVHGAELVDRLALADLPLVGLLPELLAGEPATWHGSGHVTSDGAWLYKPQSFIRRFRGVTAVDEYVSRLRTWLQPPENVPAPMLASPLDLAAAFDYLDVVWRLRFAAPLLHLPGAERTTRVAFDATTGEEFDNRLSALGELLKGMDVPGDKRQVALRRLDTFLTAQMPAEAMPRVEQAIGVLQAATHVRNAGQHVDASGRAVAGLTTLGLGYPLTDYTDAWRRVRAQVVEALGVLREEIRATI